MPFYATTPTTSPETLALLQGLVGTGALTTVTTLAPTQPSPDMQALLGTIPTAREGDVITEAYHNSVVAALRTLAVYLSHPSFARNIVDTFSPTFLKDGDQPEWRRVVGAVLQPTATTAPVSARGWMPLELTNGAKIEKLTVTGRRLGSVSDCRVFLQRMTIGDPTLAPSTLAVVDLTPSATGDGGFERSASVSVAGATPEALEQFRLVDLTKYRYVALADLTEALPGTTVRINALRVDSVRT